MEKALVLSILLLSAQGRANCPEPMKKLEMGQSAPCTGYLFSPEKELDLELKILDYEKLQRVATEQLNLVNILKQRVDTQAEKNLLLQDKLAQRDSFNDLQKLFYFGAGVLLTGLIAKTTIQTFR